MLSRRNEPADRRPGTRESGPPLETLGRVLRSGPAQPADRFPARIPPAAGAAAKRPLPPAIRENPGNGLVHPGGDPPLDPPRGGDAGPVSDPGPWDRFCARAVQRWPLVLGLGLFLAAPAAVLGFTRGERLFGAEVRIELQPQTTAAGGTAGGAAGEQALAEVPAEALAVSDLLQREAHLVRDLADGLGPGLGVSSRPPFSLVASVTRPSPAEAEAAAASLVRGYRDATRLRQPEEVALERERLGELEQRLAAQRDDVVRLNLEAARAQERIEAAPAPAVLLAEEAAATTAQREAADRLDAARSAPRDPLVFLPALLRSEPAVADAAAGATGAAADAMSAALAGRGLATPARDAAAAAAALVGEVADHRLVPTEPSGRRFVRVSALEAQTAAAEAAARAAASAAGVVAMERSSLQALRWKQEALAAEADATERAADLGRRELPAAATLAAAAAVAGSAEPVADTRPREAGFYALFGGLLGAVGALLWIAFDDRVHRADERPWEARGLAVLGTVPLVGRADAGDASAPPSAESLRRAQGEAAALADAVHAVRAMLDGRASRSGLDRDRPGGRTFTVTSPGTGSGKTGLCLGLAASLASAGERVLLVDAAWADRPAARPGPASPESPEPRQTLEAAAVSMGYLHPEEEDLLLHPDPEQPVGLPAFLDGADLADATVATRIPGLSLLPAGPGPWDASRLSGRHVRRLVEAARPLHDVTLVDTSAVSVGLDALFAAAAADGVVLVVSAGERQAAVDKVVARLRASGAEVLGTVLNRVGRPAAPRAGGTDPSAPAIESGWQDHGSGMFAAAVGGAGEAGPRRPREAAATAPNAEAETPRPAGHAARPAAASTRDGVEEEGEEVEELDVSDVLAGVSLHDDDAGDAGEAADAGERDGDDLDAITSDLAERIAAGVVQPAGAGAGGGEPDARSAGVAADPETAGAGAEAAGDLAIDRLVDRHINASLPAVEPRNGRRIEDPETPAAG